MAEPAAVAEEISGVFLREIERLHKLCWKFTQNEQDAEDAVQLTLVRALSAQRQPSVLPEIRAWLKTIARNACIDMVRERRGQLMADLDERKEEEGLSGWDRVKDRTVSVEDRLAWKQLLYSASQGLTADERRAIELVHGDGFTRREAGLLLGVSNPYPVIRAAEEKITRRLKRFAESGERNAQAVLRLLKEDAEDEDV
jgi:RNA polymerase sigma factor (sigma-70 family)